mgnify:CR=1 FL=1
MNENRLDVLKDERDLKSRDVAKYLNVNESTYSEWEHNKIPIPTRRIIELAEFYNVNIDYMLKLTDTRKVIKGKTKLDLELIGNRLKEIRQELGLSLRGLGDKLNCSFSSLGSYERGENLINCEILMSLYKYSNYSIDYILGRTNNKKIGK